MFSASRCRESHHSENGDPRANASFDQGDAGEPRGLRRPNRGQREPTTSATAAATSTTSPGQAGGWGWGRQLGHRERQRAVAGGGWRRRWRRGGWRSRQGLGQWWGALGRSGCHRWVEERHCWEGAVNRAFQTYTRSCTYRFKHTHTHTHTYTQTQKCIETNNTTSLTLPPQQNAGLPSYCTSLCPPQQSLMCTNTSNSGPMVHDKWATEQQSNGEMTVNLLNSRHSQEASCRVKPNLFEKASSLFFFHCCCLYGTRGGAKPDPNLSSWFRWITTSTFLKRQQEYRAKPNWVC